MKNKHNVLILISAIFIFGFCGCAKIQNTSASDTSMPANADITYQVLWKFYSMSKIPHVSGDEEQLAAKLQYDLEQLGFNCIRDDKNNVIAEIPATNGYEDVPLTILQGHIDMAEARENLRAPSTTQESVKVSISNSVVQSDKKSALGADCGIGNAAILYLISRPEFKHGPLRVIFTTGGKADMHGAKGLDPIYVQNAVYLINVSGVDANSIVAGCAFGRKETYTKAVSMTPNVKERAIRIRAEGFAGGRFGSDMEKNRANALKIISEILVRAKSIANFEIADWKSGLASGSIPGECEVIVTINMYDSPAFEEIIYKVMYEVQDEYKKTDPNGKITYETVQAPSFVLDQKSTDELIDLVSGLYDGIYNRAESDDIITCANLQSILIQADQIQIITEIKSMLQEEIRSIANRNAQCNAKTGFEMQAQDSDGWQMDEDNILVKLMTNAYKRRVSRDVQVIVSKDSLETACFLEKNPALYAVTVGPDIINTHTVNEYVRIDTIAPFVNALADTLQGIASQPQDEE